MLFEMGPVKISQCRRETLLA